MTRVLASLRNKIASIQPKTRKRMAGTIAIVLVLQLYFVRELIAAELLFGLLFVALFVLVSVCYLIGTVWENGLNWADLGARAAVNFTRRSYATLEELSKRPFRHPHSESAQ
jgi:glucose dehydrogenase